MNILYPLVTVGMPLTAAVAPTLTSDTPPQFLFVSLPLAIVVAVVLQLPMYSSPPLRTDKAD